MFQSVTLQEGLNESEERNKDSKNRPSIACIILKFLILISLVGASKFIPGFLNYFVIIVYKNTQRYDILLYR